MNVVPLDWSLPTRIAIFGGGGKTTLAAAIARARGLTHIELDAVHHQANWTPRPMSDVWRVVMEQIDASPQGWVTDGNYRAVRAKILSRADCAVVIQLPFPVLYWRILKRTIGRSARREELWNGNRESWRMSFLSGDSILLEVWQKRRMYRSLLRQIEAELPDHATLYPIRSTRELADFYRAHDLSIN